MMFEPGKVVKLKTQYAEIRWEGIGEAAESVKAAAKSFISHLPKLAADISKEIKEAGNVIAQQAKNVSRVIDTAAREIREHIRDGYYADALSIAASVGGRIQDAVNDEPIGPRINESIERVKNSVEESRQDLKGMINKAGKAVEQVRQIVTPVERGLNRPLMTSMTPTKPLMDPTFSTKVATQTETRKDKSFVFKPALNKPGHYLCDTPDKPVIEEECKKSGIKMRVSIHGSNHFIDFESEEIALRFLEKLALQGKDFIVISLQGDGSTVNIYDSYQGKFNVTRNISAEAARDISDFHSSLRSSVDLVNIRQEYIKEEVDQDLIENYVNFTNQRRRHQDDYLGDTELDPNEIYDEVIRLREKCELTFHNQEEAKEFFADQAEERIQFIFYSPNEAGCDYQVSVGDGRLYSGRIEDVMSQLQSQNNNNPEISKALKTLDYYQKNPPKGQSEAVEKMSSSQNADGFRH